MAELLAPVGSMKKLYTALHFGADAVYFAGKDFGLRAYADNFTEEEMQEALRITHAQGKKAYVTVNIFAKNADFGRLLSYVGDLISFGADGFIVSDPGVVYQIKKRYPQAEIHLSTQANTLNKYAVEFWRDQGVKRVVLARELSLDDIKEIASYVGDSVELEAFVHGAMCISYSGRCLLSSYLTDRDSNRGECVQACRWQYNISEVSRDKTRPLTLEEDERGSYILNSKDMNTLPFLDKIIDAGIKSLKIEGRMKSEYYVGCVVNAYRRRLDCISKGEKYDENLAEELLKVNHREYTSGFYLGKQAEMCYYTSKPLNSYDFAAEVLAYDETRGMVLVEQRNRFYKGDELETVTNDGYGTIKADYIEDEDGEEVTDCKLVQQKLWIKCGKRLNKYDILRKKRA